MGGGRKRNQKSLNILSAYFDCNDKSWVISLVIYFASAEQTRWILWGYLLHLPQQPRLFLDHFINSKFTFKWVLLCLWISREKNWTRNADFCYVETSPSVLITFLHCQSNRMGKVCFHIEANWMRKRLRNDENASERMREKIDGESANIWSQKRKINNKIYHSNVQT